MSSDIEWLVGPDGSKGEAWNPTLGCDPVSPGCLNCYAAGLAARGMCKEHRGLTKMVQRKNAAGRFVSLPVFNGVVTTHEDRLGEPLRWRKPRRVFVNSMSDLFHESIPFEFIARVFAIMASCSWHTFLVLTKRPSRAVEWFRWQEALPASSPYAVLWPERARERERLGEGQGGAPPRPIEYFSAYPPWPLPNVHVGVSAERQEEWDERTRELRKIPNALPWVSVEPQLGLIDPREALDFLRWIVVGGESGNGARPFDVGWARALLEWCRATGETGDTCVSVFVKQLGARPMTRAHRPDELHVRAVDGPDLEWPIGTLFTTAPGHMGTHWQGRWARLKDRKGKDISEWPSDLRVRSYPPASQ
jgi:protein gp37